MTLPAREIPRGRPRLTVVRGTRGPVPRDDVQDWRRVASAVVACTHEISRHLTQQRWGQVEEAMSERRELLEWLARLPLDAEGRRSLRALAQAAAESDAAIAAMMGSTRGCR
jgi:hypothetical protein